MPGVRSFRCGEIETFVHTSTRIMTQIEAAALQCGYLRSFTYLGYANTERPNTSVEMAMWTQAHWMRTRQSFMTSSMSSIFSGFQRYSEDRGTYYFYAERRPSIWRSRTVSPVQGIITGAWRNVTANTFLRIMRG